MSQIVSKRDGKMNMCYHNATSDKYLDIFIILLWPIQGSDNQLSFVYMVTNNIDRIEYSTDTLIG